MAFDISDFNRTEIYITDGWRDWYLPKFRIYMMVDEPFITIYWTDTEKGHSGLTRQLTMDYQDVTFGYISPSTAGEVELQMNIYIDSAWTDIVPGGDCEYPISTETGDFTLDLTDACEIKLCDTTTSIEILIPTNASIPFPIGTRIPINAINTGLVHCVADSGVTLQSVDNFTGIKIEGGWAWLTKIDTNTWNLEGDLKLALDADAEAYILAVEATGVTFSEAEKGYINAFFLELKAQSIYAKFYFIYLFLGGTAAAHKFNAVNPLDTDGAFRIVETGSPTHNANGVTYNGSTQHGDTKFNASTHMNQDSKNYAIYLRTNGTGTAFGAIEGVGFFRGDRLTGNFSSSSITYWSASVTADSYATPTPDTGVWMVNRDTSTNATLKKNNVLQDTDGSASTLNYNGNIYLGARNFGGSVSSWNACNVAYFSGASELTSVEETALYNAIVTLNTAFGR